MILTVCLSLVIFIASGYYFKSVILRKKPSLIGKHVLITGGSKGIGLSAAEYCLSLGASVTIVARDQETLDGAKMSLLKHLPSNSRQKVQAFSMDVTSDVSLVEQMVTDAEEEAGPIHLLMLCAGTSIASRFEETPVSEFRRMLDINLMGSVNCCQALVPLMKKRKDGVIILVSSIAGLVGLYGYTAYSASKFAVIGFAQALHMELLPFNVKVCVSMPPDTDTPGFAQEQKSKPEETRLISESGGLYQPSLVAQQAINDALEGKFTSTVGMESLMIRTVCAGVMPVSSLLELVWQVLTMPIFRIISVIFLSSCRGIVQKCHSRNESGKQQQEKGQLLNDNERESDSEASDQSRESIGDEKDDAD